VNVFKSIGLVEKTSLPSRKPGFQWLGVSRLEEIIQQRLQACRGEGGRGGEGEKENWASVCNGAGVSSWCELQQERVFLTMQMMREFNKKVFFPEIIRREPSATTLASSC
jgi:hypothetical protein